MATLKDLGDKLKSLFNSTRPVSPTPQATTRDRIQNAAGIEINRYAQTNPLLRTALTAVQEGAGFIPDIYRGAAKAITYPMMMPQARAQANLDAQMAVARQQDAMRAQQNNSNPAVIRDLMRQAELKRNQSEGLARSITTDYRQTALRSGTGGVKALLTAKGLQAGIPSIVGSAGIGGLIGGGISAVTGQDVATGIGQGIGSGPRVAGLNKLTQPMFDKVIQRIPQLQTTANSPVIERIAAGVGNVAGRANVSGLLNVAEDIPYTLGTEGRLPSAGENALSYGIGTAGPIAGSLIQAGSPTFRRLKNDVMNTIFQKITLPKRKAEADKATRQITEGVDAILRKQVTKMGFDQYKRDGRQKRNIKNARDLVQGNKESAYGLAAGIEITQDEEGNYKVTYNPEKAMLGVGLMVSAGQFKGKYKRGDLAQLERYLDDILGTETQMSTKKHTGVLPARKRAFEQLEYYAKQGDEEAQALLEQARGLEDEIAKARFAKEGIKLPKEQADVAKGRLDDVPKKYPYTDPKTGITYFQDPSKIKSNITDPLTPKQRKQMNESAKKATDEYVNQLVAKKESIPSDFIDKAPQGYVLTRWPNGDPHEFVYKPNVAQPSGRLDDVPKTSDEAWKKYFAIENGGGGTNPAEISFENTYRALFYKYAKNAKTEADIAKAKKLAFQEYSKPNVAQPSKGDVTTGNIQQSPRLPVSTTQPQGLVPQGQPASSSLQPFRVSSKPAGQGGQQPPQLPSGQTGQGGSSLPPQRSNSSVPSIPQEPTGLVQAVKNRVNQLYTETLDRFNPLSQAAKKAGKEQAMQNALTGHYGAGSTANYHVDFELTPILKEQNVDELRRAAIAMRDVELAGRGIKGSNTGDPVKALKELEAELGPEKMKSLGETLKKLYAYQDKIVQEYLVKTGIISKKSYAEMRKNNQFYIPFKRVMDEVDGFLGITPQSRGAGSVSGQNVVFKIKGSDKEIIDPIESIIESTYKSVGLGKRQQVAQTIVSLKDTLPEGMITKINGPVGNQPNIALFENGKVVHYKVPSEVADAAKGLSEEALNTVVKILALPTQVFRATATGINPEFMAPNITRDLQSAFVNAGLNPLKWVRGLSHMMKQDDVYQEFLKSGGKTSRISIDRPMLKKTVQDISGKGVSVTSPKKLFSLLQTLGEYSEQPTRIAVFEDAYKKGIKQGLDQKEAAIRAAYMAQEATVNFARRGSKTQSFNAIYAFLNARAQGVDRLVRSAKKDPVGTSLRAGMVSVAPAIALYAWNRNFESNRDERIVSKTDRNNNFIIMISDTPVKALGGAQYIKIPKGDIGKLANPVEEFLAFADGKGGDAKTALFDAIKAFSPMDNIGDVVPTALRPMVELKANKNFFFDSEIVPSYKENLPKGYQDTSYTAPIYRMIGQQLNVSPAQIQHIIEGYGTGIAKIGEMATRPFIPDQYKSAKNEQGASINRTPIARRFLGGERKTEEEQALSEQKAQESLKFRINEVKGAINRGDIPFEVGQKQIEKLRGEVKSPSGVTQSGQVISFMSADGKYKEVDLSFQPTPPEITGLEELDKKARSKFNGEITSKANDIYDLFKAGVITQDEANSELMRLKELRASAGSGGKVKKITLPKVKATNFKIAAPKRSKVQTISVKKMPKLKLGKVSKSTPVKKISVKPIKAKKLSAPSGSMRLV